MPGTARSAGGGAVTIFREQGCARNLGALVFHFFLQPMRPIFENKGKI